MEDPRECPFGSRLKRCADACVQAWNEATSETERRILEQTAEEIMSMAAGVQMRLRMAKIKHPEPASHLCEVEDCTNPREQGSTTCRHHRGQD